MSDTLQRCTWCDSSDLYRHYHDHEWGTPVADERRLFEMLSLELFQSGLSWLTILKRREGLRQAFAQFDVKKIARFDDSDVERLLADEGIVRHRGKIQAVIANARATLALREQGETLAALLWRHAPPPQAKAPKTLTVQASTDASTALARELKKRGFGWLGPTTVHAFMQATGMVNDHHPGCHAWPLAHAARQAFKPPV
jgi:DNA-3-methyladenine glycosylase I